jgi:hypothetical protein
MNNKLLNFETQSEHAIRIHVRDIVANYHHVSRIVDFLWRYRGGDKHPKGSIAFRHLIRYSHVAGSQSLLIVSNKELAPKFGLTLGSFLNEQRVFNQVQKDLNHLFIECRAEYDLEAKKGKPSSRVLHFIDEVYEILVGERVAGLQTPVEKQEYTTVRGQGVRSSKIQLDPRSYDLWMSVMDEMDRCKARVLPPPKLRAHEPSTKGKRFKKSMETVIRILAVSTADELGLTVTQMEDLRFAVSKIENGRLGRI